MSAPIPSPERPHTAKVPHRALPAYRYVPGLNPHPFRHAGGHMFTDGTPPKEDPWDPEIPWAEDERFLYGADLFDQRYYWEAHEAWEALWHFAEPDSNPHRLLQSLIQYAAAALKHHMGHTQGAERLYQRATARLEIILQSESTPYRGIHIHELIERMEDHLQGGPWPTLPMEAP